MRFADDCAVVRAVTAERQTSEHDTTEPETIIAATVEVKQNQIYLNCEFTPYKELTFF
jgi:hypothetical protein